MPGKTLVFPPKTDWPKFTDVDWNSDKSHAFLKFRRFLASMFTALDFLVGNESYGGDWALIYDTVARRAHNLKEAEGRAGTVRSNQRSSNTL